MQLDKQVLLPTSFTIPDMAERPAQLMEIPLWRSSAMAAGLMWQALQQRELYLRCPVWEGKHAEN